MSNMIPLMIVAEFSLPLGVLAVTVTMAVTVTVTVTVTAVTVARYP